jgi:3-hydroxybutyryl-CoA dehydrogenase
VSYTLPGDLDARPVAVIGAGTLGRRIALMFATRGGLVRVYDSVSQTRNDAVAYAFAELPAVAASVDGGTPGSVVAVDGLGPALKDAWLVVEAVPERLELKRQLFGEIDSLADPDAVLASNSSSYPTRLFLDHVQYPERMLNMHFYTVPELRTVELMSSGQTQRALLDLLMGELPRYGLRPFEVRKESTGFIFNRVWAAIKREALDLVAQGVSDPREFDELWSLNLGTPVGPFRAMDQVGLDVVLDIENHYADENPHLPAGPRELLRSYVDAGRLGVKAGRGFYDDYAAHAS